MNPFTKSKRWPNIRAGVSQKEYKSIGKQDGVMRGHRDYVMSRSELREFAKQPSKWLHGSPRKETDAMAHGNLLDCLMLCPELFDETYAVHPEKYQAPESKKKDAPIIDKPWNRNATFCDEWETNRERDGIEVISSADLKKAKLALKRLMEDRDICEYYTDSSCCVLVFVEYHDKETGIIVPIKCLLDLVPVTGKHEYVNTIGDLKSTVDASEHKWTKHVFEMGYYYQGALYLDAFNCATGEERNDFYHVVSESVEPYEPAQRFLSEEFKELGRAEYQRDLKFYCQCLATNTWPGYKQEASARIVAYGGWHITEPSPWMIEQVGRNAYTLPKKPTKQIEPETGDNFDQGIVP